MVDGIGKQQCAKEGVIHLCEGQHSLLGPSTEAALSPIPCQRDGMVQGQTLIDLDFMQQFPGPAPFLPCFPELAPHAV